MCVSLPCVSLVPEEAGRGHLIPWDWNETLVSHDTGGGNQTGIHWEEQSVLLTEPSLQLRDLAYFVLSVCEYVHAKARGMEFPGTGVTGGWELPDPRAGS